MPRSSPAFQTTHWSIVLNAGGGEGPVARGALESLCRQYWYPIYAFVRRGGRAHHEAEDLTQEFFRLLIASGGVATARPERGRFRTFLLAALRNFLTNEWKRAHAEKRGGGIQPGPLGIELTGAEAKFGNEPVDTNLTPEQAFDRTWAHGVVEGSLAELGAEYVASGRGALFAALGPLVWGGGATEPHAAKAAQLGLNEGALHVALHRLRKRLRERVETQIAATVAEPAEVAGELRYLISALGGKAPRP